MHQNFFLPFTKTKVRIFLTFSLKNNHLYVYQPPPPLYFIV